MILNNADNIYIGSTAAEKIYIGNTQIWPSFPADLERVEYLQSNGNQWITLPMQFRDNYHFEIDAAILENNKGLFGMYVNYDAGFATKDNFYYMYENYANYNFTPFELGERATFIEDFATKTLTIENEIRNAYWVLNNITPVNSTNPLILFAVWSSYHYGVPYKTAGRIYGVKFESTDGSGNVTQSGNYIPARRRSDSVGGFWDSVSKTFLPNEGTQPFIFPT